MTEREREGDAYRVVPTVDVVTHEKVVGVRAAATDAEELHEVVELAVDIAADGHRATHGLHVGLLNQNLAGLELERGGQRREDKEEQEEDGEEDEDRKKRRQDAE